MEDGNKMKHVDLSLLIVEDSSTVNGALCEALEKSNMPHFDLHSALTLVQAKSIIETQKIDYIILDLELPDGTGEELIHYIKSLDINKATRVIVLTGNVEKNRRDRLFQMGIIDYLSKDNPINFLTNEIIKTINHHIDNKDARILVVDDSKVYLKQVETILRNQNYIVETCLHSQDVYSTLKRDPFNLLITDVEMSEINCLELLRQIREDNELLDLPIICISNTTNQNLIAQLLKSGANDFLVKPFSVENLLLKVDVAIYLYKRQRKLSELNHFLQDEIRRKLEELRKKDKLLELENRHAQMGQMVSALTHQWKQPLQGINLAADYIKYKSTADEDTVETAEMIQEQVRFLSETMDYFKHFFKPVKEQEHFSVVGAFESVLKNLGGTYESISIIVNGDKGLYTKGYPNEFYQVVINLLNNAQDAFEEHQCEQREVKINVGQDNHQIIIHFCDNAGGIPEEIIGTLFDQYITTKGSKGTGIGLDISRMIIQKVNGTISVENRENEACFTICLPLSTDLPEGASLEKE